MRPIDQVIRENTREFEARRDWHTSTNLERRAPKDPSRPERLRTVKIHPLLEILNEELPEVLPDEQPSEITVHGSGDQVFEGRVIPFPPAE